MEEDDQVPWYCIPCLILANTEVFLFGLLPKTELCDLLGIDLPSQIDLLPSFETTSKLTNLPNLNSCDLDENLVQTINSKYYKIQELAKINIKNQLQNFSLFHVNIRSLAKHIDELLTLLYSTKIPFDVIGLTESKQSPDNDFLTNVDISLSVLEVISYILNPQRVHVEELLYLSKKSLNHKVLHNLNALEDEFETL